MIVTYKIDQTPNSPSVSSIKVTVHVNIIALGHIHMIKFSLPKINVNRKRCDGHDKGVEEAVILPIDDVFDLGAS